VAARISTGANAVEEGAAESAVLAATVDASSQAESFAQAIQVALSVLRETVNAESAGLLVQSGVGEPFRAVAGSPEAFGKTWQIAPDLPVFGRLTHYSSALPLTSGDLDTWHRWATTEAPAHVPGIETLQAMGAALAAPILVKSGLAGVLLLGRPVGRTQYTSVERHALRRAGTQFALLIENGRLTGRIVEQEKLRRELQVASEVQKRLFPEKSPETAAIACAGLCIPARGVGGDYYDFLDLGSGVTGIALADVAGKGIAAALIMSVVQASLRSLAETSMGSLADLAARMNRLLHRSTGTSSYATFFYSEYDEATRVLRYVNAGHNPPYVWRGRDGSIEELPAGGTIIGMFAQAGYEAAAVTLEPGDVFMAFSDGVPEAHNPAEEEFSEERVKEALGRSARLPVSEMSARILAELKEWMGDAEQYDDLTFLLMKIR
jgi:sigma-B regulation protein RsbU (phosphoserine phosphatase)